MRQTDSSNKSPFLNSETAHLVPTADPSAWPVHRPFLRTINGLALGFSLLIAGGCDFQGGSKPVAKTDPSATQSSSTTSNAGHSTSDESAKPPKRRTVAPVDLGSKTEETRTLSDAEKLDAIRTALKPFQVMLGKWKGLSQKTLSEQPEWAYDWVSNPKQPSLRIVSENGPYIREGRLTYLPETDQFEFASIDSTGAKHKFQGTFTEPVRDEAGDEKKPQRTYKLQLTELESGTDGELWRVTFNQQENNRYILELDRKRGAGPFVRVDTVHTQREGTSFAVSDTDYGDRTCIISQGLGTISVSYQGQSFWVCCTGCKAAFEEDPAKWIARWEEKKKSMKK